MRFWDGVRWTDHVQDPATADQDSNFWHFLRFLGVGTLMGISQVLYVGWIWFMFACARTGHRKRDVLLLLIPFYGLVVDARVLWRYTAKSVYWSPHPERPSAPLPDPWRKNLTAIGGVLFLGFLGWIAFDVATYEEPPEMTDAEWRADFVEFWTGEGIAPDVAECAAVEVDSAGPYDGEAALARAIDRAFVLCEKRVAGD